MKTSISCSSVRYLSRWIAADLQSLTTGHTPFEHMRKFVAFRRRIRCRHCHCRQAFHMSRLFLPAFQGRKNYDGVDIACLPEDSSDQASEQESCACSRLTARHSLRQLVCRLSVTNWPFSCGVVSATPGLKCDDDYLLEREGV